MGICTSNRTQKQPRIQENCEDQPPTKQLLLVNDNQQKFLPDKRPSAILTPDTTRQVETFTNLSKIRTQTQITKTVELKGNRNVSGKRQFRNIYTICNLSQHTQQSQHEQDYPRVLTVQDNQSGKVHELTIASKTDSKFIAQQIWIQNANKDNFHMCQILDIFMEQRSVLIVKEKFNSGSFEQLIKQKELDASLISELFLQMLDICQFMENNQLCMGDTNLESFELEKIGDCYIVKFCNFSEYYNANQSINENFNNIFQITQICLQLLLKKSINVKITTKNISEFIKDLPTQVISDELFQQFKNFLLKINSQEVKQDIQTISNDPFIIQIKEQLAQTQMLKLCKPTKGNKLSYFQFCILAFMVQEFQPEYAKLYFKLFQQTDYDKNGMISRKEFTQCYLNNLQQFNPEEISQIFQNIDIGEDEQIDFQEFIVAMIDKQALLNKENLKKTFLKLSNKNSTLTVKSLTKIVDANLAQLKKDFKSFGLKNLYYEDFERAMSTVEIY